MAKKYNNTWNCKKMNIDFTQKQWRQDFAAFVREKLFWDMAMCTRAIVVNGNDKKNKIKEFNVYNNIGRSVSVKFCNNNKIISSSDPNLIENYLQERNVF